MSTPVTGSIDVQVSRFTTKQITGKESRKWMAWLGWAEERSFCQAHFCPEWINRGERVFVVNGVFPVCQACTALVSTALRAGDVHGYQDVIRVIAQDERDRLGAGDHPSLIHRTQAPGETTRLENLRRDEAGYPMLDRRSWEAEVFCQLSQAATPVEVPAADDGGDDL